MLLYAGVYGARVGVYGARVWREGQQQREGREGADGLAYCDINGNPIPAIFLLHVFSVWFEDCGHTASGKNGAGSMGSVHAEPRRGCRDVGTAEELVICGPELGRHCF